VERQATGVNSWGAVLPHRACYASLMKAGDMVQVPDSRAGSRLPLHGGENGLGKVALDQEDPPYSAATHMRALGNDIIMTHSAAIVVSAGYFQACTACARSYCS